MGYRTQADYYSNVGASSDSREKFIVKTYAHLMGAIALFTILEVIFFKTGIAYSLAQSLSGNWLLVLGAMMLISWVATHFAQGHQPIHKQYLGLILYTVMQAIIFSPLLVIAFIKIGGNGIQSAALITAIGFTGLSAVVFFTRKDFSFLRSLLLWGFIIGGIGIVASIIFGFHLGTGFNIFMIALAGGAILYDTSNVIHHYREDEYVGASLNLFASVMILFWYILRFLMNRED